MKKRTLVAMFFLIIATYIYPIGVFAATTAVKKAVPTSKQVTSKKTVQNKKSVSKKVTATKKTATKTTKKVIKKTTKKKKKVVKHKDKINTTIAPLIDPSNPPGGN
jgi:anionic cell wall polymer biosynthesis LytR-Cps2A-Psr (LCP) family protein